MIPWPAIELKKLATWLSIEMISFGPALLKLVPFVSELRRSWPPSAFVWNVAFTEGVWPPGPNSVTGVDVQSGPKQKMSCALARLRSEPPIWTPLPIEAFSVIGLVIVPVALTSNAPEPAPVSSVSVSIPSPPRLLRPSETLPPIVIGSRS